MIQRISLGVILPRLRDRRQRNQQRAVDREPVDLFPSGWYEFERLVRVLRLQQLFKLADRGPLNRLSSDGAAKDEPGLFGE